ncbi:ethylene-responsive transcription factor ERF017-like [Silene latifolia]|uniref:ethylene-responsive transcription factor ERF017-like n=1 Tax=Silene latifolia TaxID=37657 RepID=UPI003D77DBEE
MAKKSSSSQQVQQNKDDSSSSSKYKGVRKRNWGKWVSEIRLPNSRERIWLGSYDAPEKAARAFDVAQVCLRGKLANLNFPDNPPQIAGGQSMTPSEIQAAAARFANLIAVAQTNCSEQELRAESDNRTESMISYSPTISDGTVQMDSEIMGVEQNFYEELSLSGALGSGNYGSEFGYLTGFEDYTASEYYTTLQPDNYEYGGESIYDASLYHDSCLWNF